MTDRQRLEIYEKDQQRLIKALNDKIKENKVLDKANKKLWYELYYTRMFLNESQAKAAKMMAEAMLEREKEMMQQ